jgi:hypothetical protein
MYSELILESSQTGKRIAITQEPNGKFIAEILDTGKSVCPYSTHDTIEEAITWSRKQIEEAV